LLNRLERTRLLQTLSHQDPVTGLLNYPHSKQALTRLLTTATMSTPIAVTLLRVTALAAIAHQHGPDAQHAILQGWGHCLQAWGRDAQTMGYWGNGEFMIAFPAATRAAAQDILDPLLQALRRQIITLPTGDRLQPAFSQATVMAPAAGHTLPLIYQAAIAQL
ncbi:MAG TPA: GGDEF domain-containing protein, partial [Candidatus Obscuribacterales bacterium]